MNRDLLTALALSAVLITGGSPAARAAMPQTSPHDWVLATENEAGPAQLHVIFSMLTEPACHHVRGEMVTGDCRFGSTSSDEKLRRVKRQRKIEVDLTQTEWTELMED